MKLVLSLTFVFFLFQEPEKKPWIGLFMAPEGKVPEVEGVKAKAAVRIDDVPASSPAAKAGVLPGDLIVGLDAKDFDVDADAAVKAVRAAVLARKVGDTLALRVIRDEVEILKDGKEAEKEAWSFEQYLRRQPPGTKVTLTGTRRLRLVEITVTLEARPADAEGKKIPDKIQAPEQAWPEEALANALIEEKKIGDAMKDLRSRLAGLHATADPFRMPRIAHIHRNPFQLRTLADYTLGHMLADTLLEAATWLDARPKRFDRLDRPADFAGFLDQIAGVVKEANDLRTKAFAALSADDVKHLDATIDSLTDRFAEAIYLDSDPDKARYARHAKTMKLAAKVDYVSLFAAAECLWRLRSPDYLDALKAAVTKEWEAKGKPGGVFLTKETAAGKVIVAGHQRTWHREDAAILIDLDGDDFYSNNAGTGRGACAMLVDFAGNDAYEATAAWSQGAGRMGVGCLIDIAGDDAYLAPKWAQGAAVLGAGMLDDRAGDDTYRGDVYVQAVALWGAAFLRDEAGADRYEARLLSQAVGMPGGAGWLIESGGDDRYYSKGRLPTNYGDAGIFDAWSQGCGVGFRNHQSGGIGLMLEMGGNDRFEAGNFSQGGGYYFGIGLIRDMSGDDSYVGSRYNQGFAAHQAAGYFEDMGGNDRYHTRQGVAQGLAWDQCVVFFLDALGDDVYEGGFFSQGATAHNSICIVIDAGGKDRYTGTKPAAAGGNDYHGGTSLSLFFDLGREEDVYESGGANKAILYAAEHGFLLDLPDGLEAALQDGAFKKLLK